jgi:hypothetical protein
LSPEAALQRGHDHATGALPPSEAPPRAAFPRTRHPRPFGQGLAGSVSALGDSREARGTEQRQKRGSAVARVLLANRSSSAPGSDCAPRSRVFACPSITDLVGASRKRPAITGNPVPPSPGAIRRAPSARLNRPTDDRPRSPKRPISLQSASIRLIRLAGHKQRPPCGYRTRAWRRRARGGS